MNNDLILTDAQGTPAGYGDTVQYILDKLGEGQLGPDVVVNGDFAADTDWTKETGWTITGGAAAKAAGTAGSIYQGSAGLAKGDLCQVTLIVSGRTAGTLTPFIRGTHSGLSISADGTYTVLVPAGTDSAYAINLYADASFDGNVESVVVREIKGHHVTQPSASLKPARGRVPVVGRRNLLPSSDLSSDAWTKNQYTFEVVAGSPALIPVSGDLARFVFDDAGLPDDDYTAQVKAKKGSDPVIRVGLGGVSDGTWPAANFDADTGQVISANPALTVHETGLTDDGYFLFRVSSENCTSRVWLSGAADGSDTAGRVNTVGDGQTPALFVDLVQLESGLTPSSIQTVSANGLDIYEPGAQHIEYLRFDHTDDKVLQTFPDGLNGDLIVCGTEGSWIDEGVSVAAGGDLEIGPKDLPNTPGVFPALGDIVGWLPIDRTLTAEERTRVIEYYKGRGAKGKLVPSGVELVTNGTFDTDSDWKKGLGWAITGGQAVANLSGSSNTYLTGLVSGLSSGKVYRVAFDYSVGSGRIRVNSAIGVVSPLRGAGEAGTEVLYAIATDGNMGIAVQAADDGTSATIDNISVQELIPEEYLA